MANMIIYNVGPNTITVLGTNISSGGNYVVPTLLSEQQLWAKDYGLRMFNYNGLINMSLDAGTTTITDYPTISYYLDLIAAGNLTES